MTAIQRVKQAIEDVKQGKMVVMVDDEDRENEGDLVYPATFSTPEKVNFMATEAKGLICVSVSDDIAKRLNLTPMVVKNDCQLETAFTVSVDARVCTTGISAHERDITIKILADCASSANELARPGHIFPLIAKKGGALVRTGHTEGSIDLCRLAGLSDSAVICEIMKEDGTMARRDDLDIFCEKHGLHIVYISDIVEYRMQHESLVREIASANTNFLGTEAKRIDMVDHEDNHHIVYTFGEVKKESAVKFHNIIPDIELFSDNEKFDAMIKAISHLKEHGGVLIFLDDENSPKREVKEYGIGAQILKKLGVEKIQLLTTSKGKEFVGLSGFGLDIAEEL
ncbi:bifunctional 3,4-dihydroxy-2-butanone 4-phosphate synthase/GTP cyclohydrolase II [Sulfurospirillum arcachonense]|uniref:bifunctional 3,4-dihydroxy-2-butanone 4-phosphate synthase/GTP cyclohydrolase II n=1 Tax=Sulfurospirillum arcachonense TaxID=57666 RepID=UPI00046A186E|nr:bifunctional 3,4-dihydroxy-2-butanone 4-phosphate synthase/GTP cyclohydrolase II [Sulfurospirillum arcachonense]